MEKSFHRILEYAGWEGTRQDHGVQLPGFFGWDQLSLVQDVVAHMAGEAQEKGFLCRDGF